MHFVVRSDADLIEKHYSTINWWDFSIKKYMWREGPYYLSIRELFIHETKPLALTPSRHFP